MTDRIRRYAIAIVGELPEEAEDALKVLELARELVLWTSKVISTAANKPPRLMAWGAGVACLMALGGG